MERITTAEFFFRIVVWFAIIALVLTGCETRTNPHISFDIDNPPEGWYRVTEEFNHYTIWLPEAWEMNTYELAPDLRSETIFRNNDEMSHDWVKIDFVTEDRFSSNLCTTVITSCQPYDLRVSADTVSCIQKDWKTDEGAPAVVEKCVIGPHNTQIYIPGLPPQDYYIYFTLFTVPEDNEESRRIFWMMIASFIQEQEIPTQE